MITAREFKCCCNQIDRIFGLYNIDNGDLKMKNKNKFQTLPVINRNIIKGFSHHPTF